MDYYTDNKQALKDLIGDLQDGNGISVMAQEDVESELDYASKCHNLEEQLGCPLDVVVKALQNGVYYEDVANCMKYMVVDLHCNLEGDFVLYFDDEECLLVRNYKKTWFLKKDKSE